MCPSHRPSLVDFANIITKKLSLLVCAHVMEQTPEADMTTLKEGTGGRSFGQYHGQFAETQENKLNK